MGNHWTRAWTDGPEVTPKADSKPTFDPLLGFENGRKPRVLNATAEEMEAVQVPQQNRGYCGREFIDYNVCAYYWPYPLTPWKCSHEHHAALHCLGEDYKIRMMEWERERRLRIRQKKIDASKAAEEIDE